MCARRCMTALIAAAIWLGAVPVRAGYTWGGDGLGVVASGTIPNGALFVQSFSPWGISYSNGPVYSTQFATPACDDVVNARLVLGIYGGSADNLASPLSVTVNGTATSLTVGGGTDNPDANPEFTTGQTNVYGSMSSGAWVVSIPVAASLCTNGSASNVTVAISSSTGFDGRIVYASLWEVYQQASLNNTFQYAVAEGSGDIYSNTPGAAQSATVPSREVDMGGFNTSTLQSAQLDTLYTYVHYQQDNRLYINGTQLGGDQAVSNPTNTSSSAWAAFPASFDVPSSALSLSDNWVKFSVDPADGVTSSGAEVLRPQVAILTAVSAPSPLWSGGGAASGAASNWSVGANWGGAVPAAGQGLVFGPLASGGYATANNDLPAGTQFAGITFNAAAAGYTLQGNAITLAGPIINQSGNNQTIGLAIQLAAGGGTLDTGSAGLTITGPISGPGIGVTKLGSGTLTLSGSNNYSGGTSVDDGLLVAESSSALPAGSLLAIGSDGSVVLGNPNLPEGLGSLLGGAGPLDVQVSGASGGAMSAAAGVGGSGGSTSAVPEPATHCLLLACLLMLAAAAMARRARLRAKAVGR